MEAGQQCEGCGNDYDPMHPCSCVTCPTCKGGRSLDDDPEVPGSRVMCMRCNGAGRCSSQAATRYIQPNYFLRSCGI
jgi:hypothetical protein